MLIKKAIDWHAPAIFGREQEGRNFGRLEEGAMAEAGMDTRGITGSGRFLSALPQWQRGGFVSVGEKTVKKWGEFAFLNR